MFSNDCTFSPRTRATPVDPLHPPGVQDASESTDAAQRLPGSYGKRPWPGGVRAGGSPGSRRGGASQRCKKSRGVIAHRRDLGQPVPRAARPRPGHGYGPELTPVADAPNGRNLGTALVAGTCNIRHASTHTRSARPARVSYRYTARMSSIKAGPWR